MAARAGSARVGTSLSRVHPLLLGVLLCIVLFHRVSPRRRGAWPRSADRRNAALLAILPIRLVLVPTDVSGLTLGTTGLGLRWQCSRQWLLRGPADNLSPKSHRVGPSEILLAMEPNA